MTIIISLITAFASISSIFTPANANITSSIEKNMVFTTDGTDVVVLNKNKVTVRFYTVDVFNSWTLDSGADWTMDAFDNFAVCPDKQEPIDKVLHTRWTKASTSYFCKLIPVSRKSNDALIKNVVFETKANGEVWVANDNDEPISLVYYDKTSAGSSQISAHRPSWWIWDGNKNPNMKYAICSVGYLAISKTTGRRWEGSGDYDCEREQP